MSKVIRMTLDHASIQAAIRELNAYKAWVIQKTEELTRRLAEIGAVNVSLGFARVFYTGDKDIDVTVEQLDENRYAIVASGETVLFLEFGSGITYGYGHADPNVDGIPMGPGTYPSDKGHWDNPHGWWIPGGEHTYGNAPAMAVYLTGKELRERLVEIAKEVFRS